MSEPIITTRLSILATGGPDEPGYPALKVGIIEMVGDIVKDPTQLTVSILISHVMIEEEAGIAGQTCFTGVILLFPDGTDEAVRIAREKWLTMHFQHAPYFAMIDSLHRWLAPPRLGGGESCLTFPATGTVNRKIS